VVLKFSLFFPRVISSTYFSLGTLGTPLNSSSIALGSAREAGTECYHHTRDQFKRTSQESANTGSRAVEAADREGTQAWRR